MESTPKKQSMAQSLESSFVSEPSGLSRVDEEQGAANALYENSPGFIFILEGPEHRFTYVNAAYKRLVGREDLLGQTVVEALPEVEDQGFVALLNQAFETGQPFIGDAMPVSFRPHGRNASIRYVSFVYQPVRDSHGRVTGLFGEGYDVTAERRASDQLIGLQTEVARLSRVSAMSLLATTIAHELSQPLNAIRSYAGGALQLLEGTEKHAAELHEALRGIDEAAQRTGEIVSSARALLTRGHATKTNFNLRAATAECIRLVLAGSQTNVSISNSVPLDLSVSADCVQIQQVIINLLRNAVQATVSIREPSICIDAIVSAGLPTLRVTDNGPGLSRKAAAHLFEWTSSSEDALGPREGGMGLGLSISRTIIEACGGRIWIEKSHSVGSRFCVAIPPAAANLVGGGAL